MRVGGGGPSCTLHRASIVEPRLVRVRVGVRVSIRVRVGVRVGVRVRVRARVSYTHRLCGCGEAACLG